MFRHLSTLFDNQELQSLVHRYDDLRSNGDSVGAAALRETIAHILNGGRKGGDLKKAC